MNFNGTLVLVKETIFLYRHLCLLPCLSFLKTQYSKTWIRKTIPINKKSVCPSRKERFRYQHSMSKDKKENSLFIL